MTSPFGDSGLSSPDISSPDLSSAGISSPDLSSGGLSTPSISTPVEEHAKSDPTIRNPTVLAKTLITLFEASPLITTKLVPQLLANPNFNPPTYSDLIDESMSAIRSWPLETQAAFVAAHPRIGEVSNLSALSAVEQASKKTSPEVLKRLEYLNVAYEKIYVGLRYITFVNGRSRAAIAEEMEAKLGLKKDEEPQLDSFKSIKPDDERWEDEVKRAVEDIGRIAKSRLNTLGVQ